MSKLHWVESRTYAMRDVAVQFADHPHPPRGRVKLDEPITVLYTGEVHRTHVDGPRFDDSFPWLRPLPAESRDHHNREWLLDGDEGRAWIRGHHDERSPLVQALLAANVLWKQDA